MADAHERFVSDFGLNIVGGCCGTTPAHLRAVIERLGRRAPEIRAPEFEPGCSSIYSHVPFHQELAYLAVGERTNANGSRKFRDAMLEADWDTCVLMAREQVKEGAHVLDVCVDYVGRDGTVDMDEIAGRFATQASLPLVFDSTEPGVVEAGLRHHGGKAILNSANLEEGDGEGKRMDRVFSLAREYGAAVICLTIDEEGQARDADWKLRVAKRIYDIAIERYGIEPTDLIFDALTFPLSTGDDDLRRDAMETIEAIRRIKVELPGASTILGLSNVSFGLKPAARHVLNSVFLHECREAGLDAAIVHAARIMPMHKIEDRQREVALDLIYDRRAENYDPLTEFMALFEGVDASAIEREDRSGWSVEERLKHRIIDGDRDGLEADLDEQMQTRPALEIINDVLARRHEGRGRALRDRRDAAAVRAAVRGDDEGRRRLPRAAHGEGRRGRQGQGRARDRARRRPRHRQEPRRHHPHEQRLHGLQPRHQDHDRRDDRQGARGRRRRDRHERPAREEHDHHAREPAGAQRARIGREGAGAARGAALTRNYVEVDLRETYEGRVFYGKDAFEGLRTMDTLMAGKKSGSLDPAFGREAGGRKLPPRRSEQLDAADIELPARSDVAIDVPVFTPPFVGSRVAKGISLDEIAAYINETALFRNQWQFRPEKTKGTPENDEEFKARLRPTLRAQLDIARKEGLLVPAAAWGYFPVNSDGNALVVWKDDSRTQEWLRFEFPRQRKAPFHCISDFFRPLETGEPDYAGFHVVTMGERASEREKELFAADQYQDYLLLHGLSVEMTEALAELWHRRIREEWGFADEDGPSLAGLVPPAVPRVALFVGLPRVPRPRGAGEARRAARDRAHRRQRSPRSSTSCPSRAPRRSSSPTPPPSTSSSDPFELA